MEIQDSCLLHLDMPRFSPLLWSQGIAGQVKERMLQYAAKTDKNMRPMLLFPEVSRAPAGIANSVLTQVSIPGCGVSDKTRVFLKASLVVVLAASIKLGMKQCAMQCHAASNK